VPYATPYDIRLRFATAGRPTPIRRGHSRVARVMPQGRHSTDPADDDRVDAKPQVSVWGAKSRFDGFDLQVHGSSMLG
jgi:hypothetical protein